MTGDWWWLTKTIKDWKWKIKKDQKRIGEGANDASISPVQTWIQLQRPAVAADFMRSHYNHHKFCILHVKIVSNSWTKNTNKWLYLKHVKWWQNGNNGRQAKNLPPQIGLVCGPVFKLDEKRKNSVTEKYLNNICICATLVWFIIFSVP